MFQELTPQDFEKTRPLFQGFPYSLAIQAALAGTCPCRIFADNLLQPRAALALTAEGYLLAGDAGDAAIRSALSEFLRDSIFTGKVHIGPDWWMELVVYPQQWEAYLPTLIPTHEAEKVPAYHYSCSRVNPVWRTFLPPGYNVYPLSAILQGEIEAQIPEELYDEYPIEAYWGTLDRFITQGMGFCAVQQGQIAAWCKANFVVRDQVEVGVHTLATHRGQGLAAAVSAAMVAHCLENGFRAVSWQCDSDNIGSWKTAEKVGFEKAQEYFYYAYIFDLGGQFAQLGWRVYHNGEFEKCIGYYEQAFAMQAEVAASDYYYTAAACAALGNRTGALQYLDKAIQMGWKAVERTRQTKHFQLIFCEADWQELIARMQAS